MARKAGRKPPGTVDWNLLKSEYVTTDASYRYLSLKYDVSTNQIMTHARNEKWQELRQKFLDDTFTANIKVAKQNEKKRYERVQRVADKLLTLLEKAVDEAADAGEMSSFRGYTIALKDIKDIQDLKSRLDIDEQKAKIENLRKQSEDGEKRQEITVSFENIDKSFME